MFKNIIVAWRGGSGAVLVVAFFLILPPPLFGQTAATGALTGSVTDPSGAVIPNVTVTVTSSDTGQARTAITGPDGAYKFNLLSPGNYRVKFEAGGFNSVEVPSATINVTETEVLNRSLIVGAQTQEVTVQADVETIQTATSALGTVVTNATATELPLSTRNYTNLLAMSAGASSPVTNATTLGKGASLISVNGGGTAQNTYLQDGVSINNWYSSNTGTEGGGWGSFAIPNPDSISEFKIQTSTYDAGYGRNPGANVNVITKSGTNNFHGAAFEFFRNTALNANDWFRDFTGGSKLVDNQNQYGGVFGGPVKKDKLFFFVSYQETGQKNGISGYGYSTANVPPIPTGNRGTCPTGWTTLSQCNAAAQSFVPALAAAVCPANHPTVKSDATVNTGSVQVLCAPTTSSPLANINPVAINLLQLQFTNGSYFLPSSGTSSYAAATFTDPATFKDHQGMGNLDYVINSKNTLSLRYEYEADPLEASFAVLNALTIGTSVPGNPMTTTKSDQSGILKLTTLLTPNLVNEARISYQRYLTVDTFGPSFTNSQVGIADLQPGIDNNDCITITSVFILGSCNGYDVRNPENQFEWADQISWTRGKHSFRAGFEIERIQYNRHQPAGDIVSMTFGSFADFLIGRAACSIPGCSASNPGTTNGSTASNLSTAGGTINSQYPYPFRTLDLNGFVQDDFKVNSRLTLNLGVRWEYDGYPTIAGGVFTDFWPSLASTVALPGSSAAAGTLAGFIVPSNYPYALPTGLYQNKTEFPTQSSPPRDDFAPRVGFAWQPRSDNRWVLRGGAGYFYDEISGQLLGDIIATTAPALGNVVSGSGLGPATLANPFVLPTGTIAGPAGTFGFSPRWVNVSAVTSSNLSQGTIEQNLTVPVTYQWNLNTQYEFLPTWVLELGYVGSHGIHQVAESQSGAQGMGSSIPYNLAPLAGSNCTSCALTGAAANTVANVVLRVPNLGMSAQESEAATNSDYKYNGLQATVRKQLAHGVQLQAAYSWSRAFISSAYGVNTAPFLIQQYGLNGNYRPQRFVVNYVWNLPLGHPEGILGKIAEGWTWSGVTTVQDGQPLTMSDARGGSIFFGGTGANSTAQFCSGMGPANVLTTGSLDQRVKSGLTNGPGYLNGTAQGVFCAPPTGGAFGNGTGFGNAGLGIVLGPGQSNWDMSLAKTTSIREGQTVQFRAEFFNTFNHPQFSIPSLTANASTFGQISSASVNPRIVQFALKYVF